MKDIILVDEVTQSMMKHNPQEINSSYETAIATTLDKKGYCIRPCSGNKNITIAEYVASASKGDTFVQYIVPSGLYKNVYFEAKNFDKQYWEEYVNILTVFVTRLGGGSVVDVYYKTERNENVSNEATKNGFVFGALKGKTQTETSKITEESFEKLKHIEANNPKCSKKDIEQWIEQERIDVESLPKHLRDMIKIFLDKGRLESKCLDVEKIYTKTEEMIEKIMNLKVNVKTSWFNRLLRKSPIQLFEDIDAHIQDLQKTFKKVQIKKEIRIEAHFKHDGVI